MPSSVVKQLVTQSQDAALTAVQVFNSPLIRFKSESFIVLINIAWTYLLHAHFRESGVEYRYYKGEGQGRRYERTPNGAFRYWDLRRCLADAACPLDNETRKNLEFLIGLRDEITHHMSPALDEFASARYQAACLNYNRYVKELFGDQHGIDRHLGYSLQFGQVNREQLTAPTANQLPGSVRSFIARFDSGLSEQEMNSDRFAYRMLFVPKLVGKPGQADQVVEFFRPDSDVAVQINKSLVAVKEVERPKVLPGEVVATMREEGFPGFNMHHHTQLWKSLDAKREGKGFGVSVAGSWYWYEKWLNVVRAHCADNRSLYC